MKRFVKLILSLFITLSCIVAPLTSTVKAATNDQSSTKEATESLAAVKKRGKLVVGVSADYPPYEFTAKVGSKTEYVGMDIEIAKQVAKDMGVKLEIKNMDFDSLLVALETHKIDATISGINPTPERRKNVDFTDLYYSGKQVILINKRTASEYKNAASFDGKKVGAQTGSLLYDLVKEQMPKAQVKGLAKLNNLVIALKSNKVDGVAMDYPTAKAYAENNPDLTTMDPHFIVDKDQTGYAMAFAKGADSLVASANKTIAKIKQKDLITSEYIPQASKYMTQSTKENKMVDYWTYFAKGVEYTLIITIVSVFFGAILGTLLAIMRLAHNKVIHYLAVAYIEFVRGTPLMVQVMFVYFGIGAVIQSMPALVAGIIATSLNSAAYVAEIIRSGIDSIPVGQTEAARSLGMSQAKAYRYVILPQALKNIWPALGNEFITLIKESSIVSVIGVADLMYQTQLVQSATYKGVAPLFVTMLIYFVLTFTLSKVLNHVERKMNHA
ncbi:ABC transporter substrate-binding protein/permease [Ligilactobacillus saerimneri]|uniref:ABC transporter substrate-binding protein/permease n=1 Tax=Ligilactobacillus saerimneri TaxID=228229 RepID=UPI001D70C104|nr:ABC transporter substrate-binding protein/permease [Ligilactobacillus saerimneri]HJF29731.1 ABC transporter substrate-binding protein/permease [Ligilactobacillus saerimneri]